MNWMEWIAQLSSLILVNIVLSGDNAVVIAMASRALPPQQRKAAILVGSGGAIVLRVILTIVAVELLKVSYLQFAGGVLLVWIAAKLLTEDEKGENIRAGDRLWSAVRTIIVADLVMSLDNTLALAAVAGGNLILLAIGLALSIPLIVFGAQVIMKVMERIPAVIYAGAGLIAWTAGKMMVEDPKMGAHLHFMPEWTLPVVITAGVLAMGFRAQKLRQKEA
jgi:YjbE family integral membrane protein